MKRIALYIAVLFFTFTSSTVATFIWNDQYWGFAVGSGGMCIDAGEGFSGGGGFRSFVFYDGTKLAFSRIGFDSVEAAQGCYQSELQKATKIIERETLFDEAREKVVGERVVAIFPPNEYVDNEWARILSLDGDRIFQITSPSLRHAINFEKRNRKY